MSPATMTEDDLLFDLDLRILPVDEKEDFTGNPNASGDCVNTTYVSWTCTQRCSATCRTCYTCRRPNCYH